MTHHDFAIAAAMIGLFVGGVSILVPIGFGLTRFRALMLFILCLVVITRAAADEKGSSPSNQASTRVFEIDPNRLLFTNEDALVCPQSFRFDKRSSHSYQNFVSAAETIWGKQAKAEALGCDLLKSSQWLYSPSIDGDEIIFSLREDQSPNSLTLKSQVHNAETSLEKTWEASFETNRAALALLPRIFPVADSGMRVDFEKPTFLIPGALMCEDPYAFANIYNALRAGEKIVLGKYSCFSLAGDAKIHLISITPDKTLLKATVDLEPGKPFLPRWMLATSFRN
jgi:hypothetical protein